MAEGIGDDGAGIVEEGAEWPHLKMALAVNVAVCDAERRYSRTRWERWGVRITRPFAQWSPLCDGLVLRGGQLAAENSRNDEPERARRVLALCSIPVARKLARVKRKITGFHQDAESDWVAELVCGHNQHVRHRPPWTLRPWVVTPEGRNSMIGTELDCKKCDVGAPPDRLA
jgi:hypothetical protein